MPLETPRQRYSWPRSDCGSGPALRRFYARLGGSSFANAAVHSQRYARPAVCLYMVVLRCVVASSPRPQRTTMDVHVHVDVLTPVFLHRRHALSSSPPSRYCCATTTPRVLESHRNMQARNQRITTIERNIASLSSRFCTNRSPRRATASAHFNHGLPKSVKRLRGVAIATEL